MHGRLQKKSVRKLANNDARSQSRRELEFLWPDYPVVCPGNAEERA